MSYWLWIELTLDLVLLTVVAGYFKKLRSEKISPVRLWGIWFIWLVAFGMVVYTAWQLWHH